MNRRVIAILAFVALLAMCCGCMGRVITEDYPSQDLPDIDPEDGVEKEVTATLYYRLTDEKYLVGVNRNIPVRASERTEAAIIRTLIAGVPLLARDVSALFNPGVQVLDVSYEGGILYVTLSEEFLDDSVVSNIQRENYLSDDDYAAAVDEAEAEMRLARRLGVLSIVNTIVGSSDNQELKVQMLIGSDGSGAGRRMPYREMGFDGYGQELIEPMSFDADAIATPAKVAECLLERMVQKQYEMAYVLVAESDDTGTAKPTYADFETELRSLGEITSYSIKGSQSEAGGAWVSVDVKYIAPDGTVIQVINSNIYLQEEGDIYKAGYSSLKGIMEN